MKPDDRKPTDVETLIPWYAAGSLGTEERAQVEELIAADAEASALAKRAGSIAAHAREFVVSDHPHAAHLDAYARNVYAREDATRARIEKHLESCDVCRDALVHLRHCAALDRSRDAEDGGSGSARSTRGVASPRRRSPLVRSLLSPAAAAVYLVGVAALAGLWLTGSPSVNEMATWDVAVPQRASVERDVILRGGPAEDPPTIRVSSATPLLLEFRTDVTAEEIGTGSQLEIRIEREGTLVATRRARTADLDATTSLQVLIDHRATNEPREWSVALVDTSTGEELSRSTFVLILDQ